MDTIYSYFDVKQTDDLGDLLLNADDAARTLVELGKPEDAERQIALQSYEEDFVVRMTHGSASIEGSTLTLQETALVLDHEFLPKDIKQRDDMMSSMGIYDAYTFAMRQAAEGRTLDRPLIQDIHEHVAIDMDTSVRGIFRHIPVYIKGSTTVPPVADKVRELLDDLIFLYEQSKLHPLAAIAASHKAFESIHPFVDGNGRTGRVLMNFQLVTRGYPPIAVDADSRQRYLTALEDWTVSQNPVSLVSLICDKVIEESKRRIEILG